MTSNKCQHGQIITQFCIAQQCSQMLCAGCPQCMKEFHTHHHSQSYHKKQVAHIEKINAIINSFTVEAAKPKCRSLQQAILSTFASIKNQISNVLDIVGKNLINRIGYPYLSKHNQLLTFKRLKNKQYKKVGGKQFRDFYNFADILNKGNQWIKKQNQIYAEQIKKLLPFIKELESQVFQIKSVIEKFQISHSINNFNNKQDQHYGVQKIEELINNVLHRKQNLISNEKKKVTISVTSPPINQQTNINSSKNTQNVKTFKVKNKTTKEQSSLFDKKSQFLEFEKSDEKSQKSSDKSNNKSSSKKLLLKNYVINEENLQGSNRSRKFTQYDKKNTQIKSDNGLKKQRSVKMGMVTNNLAVANNQNQVRARKISIQRAIDIQFGKFNHKKQQNLQKKKALENSFGYFVTRTATGDLEKNLNDFEKKRKQQSNSSSKGRVEDFNDTNAINKSQVCDVIHTLLPESVQRKTISSFNEDIQTHFSQKTIIVQMPTHTKDDHQIQSNYINRPRNLNRNFSLIKGKNANKSFKNTNQQQQQDQLLYMDNDQKSLLCYIKSLTLSENEAIKYLQSALLYSKFNLSAAQYLSFLYLKFNRPKDCYDVCHNIMDKIRHSKEGPEIGVNIMINKTAALNSLGRYSQTVKKIQNYLVYKKHEKLYKNYADALYFLGKTHEAIKSYQTAIKINENFGQAYYNLSACYYSLQNYLMGKAMILKALALDTNNQNYLQLKNRIFSKLKNKEGIQ